MHALPARELTVEHRPASVASAAQAYTVQPGDSLSLLAQRFLGSEDMWWHIFAANRGRIQDPNLIYPGQRLVIPHGGAVRPKPAPATGAARVHTPVPTPVQAPVPHRPLPDPPQAPARPVPPAVTRPVHRALAAPAPAVQRPAIGSAEIPGIPGIPVVPGVAGSVSLAPGESFHVSPHHAAHRAVAHPAAPAVHQKPRPAPAASLLPPGVPPIAGLHILHAAAATGMPVRVVAAQNDVESSYGTNMGPSSAGAMGPWQFEPYTWPSYSSAPFSMATNWDASTSAYIRYMRVLLQWSGGNVRQALAAYNAGEGNWGAGLGYADQILSMAG